MHNPATSTREKTSVPSHEIHVGSLLQLDFSASSTAKSANSWHGTSYFLPASRVSNFVHHLWALTFLPYFELTLDFGHKKTHKPLKSPLKKKTKQKRTFKKTWWNKKKTTKQQQRAFFAPVRSDLVIDIASMALAFVACWLSNSPPRASMSLLVASTPRTAHGFPPKKHLQYSDLTVF